TDVVPDVDTSVGQENLENTVISESPKHVTIPETDKSLAVKMPIAFTTLMCGIILNQHSGVCVSTDVPCRKEPDLSLDYRLFEGTHAADIAPPS
ncbi:envelope-like protein, partial [Trifolium medium]|nr:envelope-like protein [Trifolium medium]